MAQTAPAASPATSEEILELSPFVVTSTEGSDVTESTSGTLVSRPLEKTPMGISVFSAEMMKDLMVLNGDQLTKIVPGLAAQNNQTSEGAGGNQQYANRGFTVLPRRNGFAPGGRLYDMTGVDRVEIIRGPNSILYGQNDPGGVINFITKRPRLRSETGVRGVATASMGDYSFYRAQTDFDITLVPGKLGFRLPMSYTYNERDSKWFSNQVVSINPSALWRIFPNTELTFEYEYLEIETGFGALQPIVWVPPGQTTEVVDKNKRGLGRETNYTFGPFSSANNTMTNWTVDLTSRLTDHITFRGIYSRNNRDRDQVTPGGGDPFRVTPTPFFGVEQQDGNEISGYKGDLLAEYDFGPIKSRTVIGYEWNTNDYFFKEWRTFQNGATLNLFTLNVGYDPVTRLATRDTVASDYVPFPKNNYITNSIDPTNTLGGNANSIPTQVDPNNPWRLFRGPQRFTSTWSNTRISEVLSAYDDRFQLLLGYARGKLIENYNHQTKVKIELPSTPIYQVGVGALVDKAKKHMLFANYSTSYAPQFLLDINNEFLPPQEAQGLEGGIKSVWNPALRTTLTVFSQKRTNVGRQFNDQSLVPPRTYGVLSPGEESKGYEFEATYKPTKALDLRVGWAFYDGKITGASATEQFKIGRELPRAPEKSGTFSASYTVQGGMAAGLRLGYGFTYKNDTILDLNNGLNSLTRRSDEYLVHWVTAAKEFKLANKHAIVVRLNVGNLFDKNYVTEGFTYGEYRTIRLSTDYKF
ncbi:TonB-dependent siderophore receptor [Lacunisphaera limnophila]|uniref:TonB-dependent siderophore receptor n=1 Tax=Lacunisphaera limnophila TaxID=1838286 RepID=UPI0012FD4D25|nr:TonB-dependent receptor plug domain-containing protein [Lacunisphaera limnophila]